MCRLADTAMSSRLPASLDVGDHLAGNSLFLRRFTIGETAALLADLLRSHLDRPRPIDELLQSSIWHLSFAGFRTIHNSRCRRSNASKLCTLDTAARGNRETLDGDGSASEAAHVGHPVRAFQEHPRPERGNLRWDAVMMVPPTISHQRIADNLARLLNDALARHAPTELRFPFGSRTRRRRVCAHRRRLSPEPDVMVIDGNFERASASWIAPLVPRSFPIPTTCRAQNKGPWIAVKRRLYQATRLASGAVDRSLFDRGRSRRAHAAGWESAQLTRLDEPLIIPSCASVPWPISTTVRAQSQSAL